MSATNSFGLTQVDRYDYSIRSTTKRLVCASAPFPISRMNAVKMFQRIVLNFSQTAVVLLILRVAINAHVRSRFLQAVPHRDWD